MSDNKYAIDGLDDLLAIHKKFDDMVENNFSKLGASIPDFKINILKTWETENIIFVRSDLTSEKFDKPLPSLHMMEVNSDGEITFFHAFDDTHGLGVADASK